MLAQSQLCFSRRFPNPGWCDGSSPRDLEAKRGARGYRSLVSRSCVQLVDRPASLAPSGDGLCNMCGRPSGSYRCRQ